MPDQARAETVVVLGASPKRERYSYRAMAMLREYGHRPVPVNPTSTEVLGEKCYRSIADIPGPIDTVTVYLRKTRSDPLRRDILQAKPPRIIFNPGAENHELATQARERGIEVIEGCTLVMLRSGTF